MLSLLASRHKLVMQIRALSSIGLLSYLRIYKHEISTKISVYIAEMYVLLCALKLHNLCKTHPHTFAFTHLDLEIR